MLQQCPEKWLHKASVWRIKHKFIHFTFYRFHNKNHLAQMWSHAENTEIAFSYLCHNVLYKFHLHISVFSDRGKKTKHLIPRPSISVISSFQCETLHAVPFISHGSILHAISFFMCFNLSHMQNNYIGFFAFT